jgi:signal transduction histidine kinase
VAGSGYGGRAGISPATVTVPAAARRRPGPAGALLDIVSPATWLAVVHLLGGLIIGLVSCILVLVCIGTGLGTAPAALIGIPVVAVVLWLCRWFARAERARFRLLLGREIAVPPAPERTNWWRGMWRILRSGAAWRAAAYAVLRLPLSAADFVLVTLVWSLALALITLPGYNWALPGGGAHLGSHLIRYPGPLIVAVLIGLVVLLAAPPVTRGLAAADVAVARWLLASGRQADLTARIGALETSRAKVMDAAEAERMRIERDLHDGAQQRLVSLAMELGRAKAKFGTDPEAAEMIVGQAHEQAKEALTELRNLVRGVHPPVLSDRGLDAALSGLAALSPIPVTVSADLPARPPATIEAIAYFVVAEALTNIAKHAHASHARVIVVRAGDLLSLEVTDDGIGGADPAGQGLSGLAARVAGVDGQFRVTSPAGGPTTLEVTLPCGS